MHGFLGLSAAMAFGGFNPRPPLPGGDAGVTYQYSDGTTHVSIHAPRCREAMHLTNQRPRRSRKFQSTPPVAGRRCHELSPYPTSHIGFNPRPPLPGGDAMTVDDHIHVIMFQSTPPVAGRRCTRVMTKSKAGKKVSIHAPRCREAMPNYSPTIVRDMPFQSTPPVAGRRCLTIEHIPCPPVNVSIHAPRCREAMLERFHEFILCLFLFQSTPPVAGRRCLRLTGCSKIGVKSFNPRPPLPGGDATNY